MTRVPEPPPPLKVTVGLVYPAPGWSTVIPVTAPDVATVALPAAPVPAPDPFEPLTMRDMMGDMAHGDAPSGTSHAHGSQLPAGAGAALRRLYRDRLLVLQYETLTTDPAKAMQAIYAFIGEPAFEHDFDHVEYDVTEFDERAGTPGLHTVRGTVRAEPRDTLLPPDLFNRFVNDAFWRDPGRIPAGLRVV